METLDLDAVLDTAATVKINEKEVKVLYPSTKQVKAWNEKSREVFASEDPADIVERIRELVGVIVPNAPVKDLEPHKLYPLYRLCERLIRQALNPSGIELSDEELKNIVRAKMSSTSSPA